jgi:hypothetical protein
MTDHARDGQRALLLIHESNIFRSASVLGIQSYHPALINS